MIESRIGTKKVEGAQTLASVYEVLSLDAQTGRIKDKRELTAFGSMELFATNDEHIIVSGHTVNRLSENLKDEVTSKEHGGTHKNRQIQNISPDGSTLGNATIPGFELVDAKTLTFTSITDKMGALDASVSQRAFVSTIVSHKQEFPKDDGFTTYWDVSGNRLIYHGACSQPQFLTNDLIVEAGCKTPVIIDTLGTVVTTLSYRGAFSYAGVSRNGKRLAMQLPAVLDEKPIRHEKFVIYSVANGDVIAEITPDIDGEGQSWTAFSPDGSMFAVGSPLKLTLYRLP